MADTRRDEIPNPPPDITIPLEQHAAWKRAKRTYEEAKSQLKAKDLELIMGSDTPDDLIRFLEKVKTDRGHYAKTMGFIQKCLSVLKEREGLIDMLLACAGPPGRLAWSSTKLVLCVFRGYVDEFKALLSVTSVLTGKIYLHISITFRKLPSEFFSPLDQTVCLLTAVRALLPVRNLQPFPSYVLRGNHLGAM